MCTIISKDKWELDWQLYRIVQAGVPEEIQVSMQLPVESTVQYISVHYTVQLCT